MPTPDSCPQPRTRLLFLFLVLCMFSMWAVAPARAQRTWGNPTVHHPVYHDVSRPLREIPPGIDLRQHVRPLRHPFPLLPNTSFSDPVAQTVAGPMVSTSSGTNFDGVGVGFGNYSVQVAPPDPNLSVGDTQVVQWVNTSFAVFDKATGALLYGPAAGNTLWANTGGGPCEVNNDGDPIVLFDKAAHRWVMTQLSVSGGPPYYQCFAISTTSDATGSFVRYIYQMPNFNDYPKLGVWSDAYYMSFNMFQDYIIFSIFQGAAPCAFDRNAMLAAQSATMLCFQLSSSYASLLPADLDGSTLPAAGSPGLFLSLNTNSVDLWRFHVDFVTTSNSQLTGPINIPVASFSQACGGGTCIPQAGTTQQLDSLGDRLMYRLPYRNFGDHEALLANHSVTVGTSVGVRWYEIRSPFATPTVFQQGTYAPDTNFRWMASIGMDHAGNIAMGYSQSSSAMYPAINYTGRVPGDTAGTMEGENTIISGTGSQNGGLSRWGDYTAISIDPGDDCAFWYTDEYLKTTGSFNWSTRLASFSFPSCGGALTTASVSPTSLAFSSQSVGTTSNPQPVTVTNTGSATLNVSKVTVTGANPGDFVASNGCSSGVAPGSTCPINVSFTPQLQGTRTATLDVFDNTSDSPQTVGLSGTAAGLAATQTALTSSPNPSSYGQSVTFTATVTSAGGTPTGMVTFLDGGNAIGSSTLNTSGQAALAYSSLPIGTHSITAAYGGDSNFSGSTSGALTQTVNKAATSTSLKSSANPAKAGQTVTFTATVTSSAGVPTGTVTFKNGSTVMGSAALTSGQATFSTSFKVGTYSITAVYGGDANFASSTSPVLTQKVTHK